MAPSAKRSSENWLMLWQWCLAAAGAVLTIVLGILVGSRFPSPLSAWPLRWDIEPHLARFTLGAVVGLAQWVVLRSRVRRAGWWVLATALAWTLGWARLEDELHLPSAVEYSLIAVAIGAAAGGVAGLGPWLLLRRHGSRSGWLLAVPAAVGALIGLALAFVRLLSGHTVGDVLGLVLSQREAWAVRGTGAAAGLACGLGGLLAARRRAPGRSWLVLTLGLGGGLLGWFLAWSIWGGWSYLIFHDGVQGLVLGALTGLAQWLVLVRQVPRSGWWIPASAAGWMTSMALLGALPPLRILPDMGVLVLGLIGLPPVLFTGAALVLLLGQGLRTAAAAAPASSHPAG